jgi:hypothetical protein
MSSDYVLCDRRELHEYASVFFDDNEEVFEFEQDAAPPPLKGRLKNHVTFWESINANRFIVEVIKSGYLVQVLIAKWPTIVSRCCRCSHWKGC